MTLKLFVLIVCSRLNILLQREAMIAIVTNKLLFAETLVTRARLAGIDLGRDVKLRRRWHEALLIRLDKNYLKIDL